MRLTAWFDDIRKTDLPEVGGKGANLGELAAAGIHVPPGFVITADAYSGTLTDSGISARIAAALATSSEPPAGARQTAALIKEIFGTVSLPSNLADEILSCYRTLGSGHVAVRSSATAEDLAEASFAGQQSTYLNVRGEPQLLAAIEDCWASLFEEHAISYRARQQFDHLEAKMAVVVQEMVQSHRSGVMFTVNPVTGDNGEVVIEAAYGLGEAVVSGVITPDMYILDKSTAAVVSSDVSEQDRELVRNDDARPGEDPNHWLPIEPARGRTQKLAPDELTELLKLALRVEEHYGGPQDIEWAEAGGQFHILQARPVTTVGL